ncbi:hypothetical protein [Streptomyces sp. NBC_01455]|uniref:hypothetical protein n=1 Tax=Streptomyces sp. NBC_01455 TaxID=2903874 RepID=UPI002E340D35|nr:hypothetical protein [Streptomyces sp. NBC_01455]
MASDIYIPGDELMEAQKMLDFVHDNIDIGHNHFDFGAAFVPELSRGAAQELRGPVG